MQQTIYITKVRTIEGKGMARLLVESIRTFGGELSACPIWIFALNPEEVPCRELESPLTRVIPLQAPAHLLNYTLGDKVYACARAEEMFPAGVDTLAWIDASCLVVNPPVLFTLDGTIDAAFRPVHIRNVGLSVSSPLDAYWTKVYQTAGVGDMEGSVESFVDQQHIRSYFNTHAFSINPTRGLLQRWLECFEKLVLDRDFQAGPCQDELHQTFLHQAVLSALVASTIPPNQVRILPPEYNYPYNLHERVPPERQARALDELVSFTYEDRVLDPASINDIEIGEPLRSWLARYV